MNSCFSRYSETYKYIITWQKSIVRGMVSETWPFRVAETKSSHRSARERYQKLEKKQFALNTEVLRKNEEKLYDSSSHN